MAKHGKLMEALLKEIAQDLLAEGRKIITGACRTKDTDRDTGAQENAYCTGVYYNEEMIGFDYVDVAPQERPKTSGKQEYWGREMAKKYLDGAAREASKGCIALVVANVMWYSWVQEEGFTSSGRQYRILSHWFGGLNTALAKIRAKYGKGIKGSINRYGID